MHTEKKTYWWACRLSPCSLSVPWDVCTGTWQLCQCHWPSDAHCWWQGTATTSTSPSTIQTSTTFQIPLAFRRSLLITGNCNKKHIPINNTNTYHLPDTTGLQSLSADHWELHQEACNDQIHTWTHLALLTFGYPKSLHVFAPTYITTSTLQRHKHMCAYTQTNTSQIFHPYKHLTITLEASDKHLTLSLKVKHLYIDLVKHLYINLANIWSYKHLTSI